MSAYSFDRLLWHRSGVSKSTTRAICQKLLIDYCTKQLSFRQQEQRSKQNFTALLTRMKQNVSYIATIKWPVKYIWVYKKAKFALASSASDTPTHKPHPTYGGAATSWWLLYCNQVIPIGSQVPVTGYRLCNPEMMHTKWCTPQRATVIVVWRTADICVCAYFDEGHKTCVLSKTVSRPDWECDRIGGGGECQLSPTPLRSINQHQSGDLCIYNERKYCTKKRQCKTGF